MLAAQLVCYTIWHIWCLDLVVWLPISIINFLAVVTEVRLDFVMIFTCWLSLFWNPSPWSYTVQGRQDGATFVIEDLYRVWLWMATPVILLSGHKFVSWATNFLDSFDQPDSELPDPDWPVQLWTPLHSGFTTDKPRCPRPGFATDSHVLHVPKPPPGSNAVQLPDQHFGDSDDSSLPDEELDLIFTTLRRTSRRRIPLKFGPKTEYRITPKFFAYADDTTPEEADCRQDDVSATTLRADESTSLIAHGEETEPFPKEQLHMVCLGEQESESRQDATAIRRDGAFMDNTYKSRPQLENPFGATVKGPAVPPIDDGSKRHTSLGTLQETKSHGLDPAVEDTDKDLNRAGSETQDPESFSIENRDNGGQKASLSNPDGSVQPLCTEGVKPELLDVRSVGSDHKALPMDGELDDIEQSRQNPSPTMIFSAETIAELSGLTQASSRASTFDWDREMAEHHASITRHQAAAALKSVQEADDVEKGPLDALEVAAAIAARPKISLKRRKAVSAPPNAR